MERVTVLRGVEPDRYGSGYWEASITAIVATWPNAQRSRVDNVLREGATLAFWRSTADGRPSNGGGGGTRYIGTVEEIAGPLELCGRGALHATLEPGKWKGDKVWIVALFGEIAKDDDKIGALKREILGVAWTAPSAEVAT